MILKYFKKLVFPPKHKITFHLDPTFTVWMKSQRFPTPAQYWSLCCHKSCELHCHPSGNLFSHVHYATVLHFKMTEVPEWSNIQVHSDYGIDYSEAFAITANHDAAQTETKIPSLKKLERSPNN